MDKWRYLSAAGLIAIALAEGYSYLPYQDQGGVWTDGFGNTHQVQPSKPKPVPKALSDLDSNTQAASEAVNRCVTVHISQKTFDAFVSFTYNAGGSAFCKSTMLKKFNAGDGVGACNELMRWVYVGGVKNKGLMTRREREKAMCLEGLK